MSGYWKCKNCGENCCVNEELETLQRQLDEARAACAEYRKALEDYCALPLPLDEMPRMTIAQALELFAVRIKSSRDVVNRPNPGSRILAQLEAAKRLEDSAKHTFNYCLCNRDTYGFDYGEKHPRAGKAKVGARWLTPSEVAESALAAWEAVKK